MKRFLLACAFALSSLMAGGAAAAPDTSLTIAYQGFLADLKAQPIDGARHIVFTLHSDATGGKELWNETHEGVVVAKGVFSVMLGSIQPLEVLTFDNARWLGIRVSGEEFEMEPRQRLGSAPFAFIAQRANALSANATIQGSQITGPITGATVPGVAPWVAIGGASQQAVSNTSYLSTGTSHITLTLPAAPAVGDVVKASSAGGWTVVPNAGQTMLGSVVPAPAWIPRGSNRQWWAVASSADGTKLVAAELGGLLYTSINGGIDWTPRDSARAWVTLASSADGAKLVAGVSNGQLFASVDYGVSWIPHVLVKNWVSVASSADGMKLVAVENPGGVDNPGGQIHTSPDGGVNWFPRDSPRAWTSVASSADGAKLVAAVSNGQLHTSLDSGLNWTARDSVRRWVAVASSADGARLAAVADKDPSGNAVFTSIDSGVTWVGRGQGGNWSHLSSSADGIKLLGAQGWTTISLDGGLTWTVTGPAGVSSVNAIAISSDGNKLVAAVRPGPIFISDFSTISGVPFSAIELVYSGGGNWMIVSRQGLVNMP